MKPLPFSLPFLLAWLLLTNILSTDAQAQVSLARTPPDQEGPFYPVTRQQDEDNDLLQINGRPHRAQGTILRLSGLVRDAGGQPLADAIVEIWQTDRNGRYNDPRDTSPGPRDPDFQYWGKATTGKDGTYSFTTLVPGNYAPRPPHIHFKVWHQGTLRLTSQLYFRNYPDSNPDGQIRYRTNDLQTVDLEEVRSGEYKAFFAIVL